MSRYMLSWVVLVVFYYIAGWEISAGLSFWDGESALLWTLEGHKWDSEEGISAHRVSADLYSIWRAIAEFGFTGEGVAILLPCTHHHLMTAILAQSSPRLLCTCADAYDVTSVNPSVSVTIHVFEEPVQDTIDTLLQQNNVESIIYMSNSDRINFGDHTMSLGAECGDFQRTITRNPSDMVTVVVDCEGYNISKGHVLIHCGDTCKRKRPRDESVGQTCENCLYMPSAGNPWYDVLRKCRQNIISNIKFNTSFGGFHDRVFQVGVLDYEPYVITTEEGNTKKYSGFCIELIDILSHMMNFRYNFIDLGENFGYIENGTWHGSIQKIIDGEVDMVLTGLTISSERIEVVDFAYPFWEERLAMITLTEPRHQFYLFKPLTIPVWLLYVFAAVYVALCIKSLECISLYLHHGVSLARDALGQTLLFTWGAMWNIGGDYSPRCGSARLLVACFWVCVIVLLATYNAKLYTFLAMKERKLPFNTLAGALEAKGVEFYVARTKVGRSLFEEATKGVFAEVWSKMIQDPLKYLVDEIEPALLNMFETGTPAVLFDDLTVILVKVRDMPYCNWGIMDESFLPLGVGIAFHKGSPFNRHFDNAMIRLHESGILVYLKRKYFRFLEETHCSPTVQVGSSKIGLGDMWPQFTVGAAGLGLAIMVMVMELLYVKPRRRKTFLHE